MKKLGSFAIIMVVLGAVCLFVRPWRSFALGVWRQVLFDRQVLVSGNIYLQEQQLLRLLPTDQNTLVWYYNLPELEVGLRQHPLIQTATIKPCADLFKWGCFLVQVSEREPRFRAFVAGEEWLVDKDGVFLARVVERVAGDSGIAKQFSSLPIIRGLVKNSESTDVVYARLRFLTKSILELQAETGRYVTLVELLDQEEMRVYFEGVAFPVRFANFEKAQPGGKAPLSLLEQVARMQLVLKRLPEDRDIQELDLAFSRFAVLR